MTAALATAALALLAVPAGRRRYDRLQVLLQPPQDRRRRWIPAAASGVLLCALALGPMMTAISAAIACCGWRVGRMLLDRREIRRQEESLLQAVAALSSELRAGRTPPAALAAAAAGVDGRLARVLHDAAASAGYGGDAGRMLSAAGRSARSPGLRSGLVRLGAAWSVSARSGAAWSDVIQRVEGDLRGDRRHRQRIAAELAGCRATAVLLAGLPLVGLVLGSSLGADPVHVLTRTRPGQVALAAGIALDLLGVLWTARIVRSAQDSA